MTPEVKERIEQIRHGNVPEGYERHECGIVPIDWNVKPLSAIIQNELRAVPKPSEPYWRVGVRSWAKGTFRAFVEDPSTVDMEELYVVRENDLVVNITFAWEQAIALAQKVDDGLLVSHRFPTYVFINGNVSSFYKAIVSQKRFKYLLELISPGGAGRNRVMDRKAFLKLSVPVPELQEQRKIAEVLEAQERTIELKEKLLAEKQCQKKYLMQQILTGKKRLPGFEGEWQNCRLHQIAKRIRGKNTVGNENVLTISAQYGLINQSEFFNKEIASEDKSNYYLLNRNDFAYNKSYSSGYPFGAIKRLTRYDMGIVSPLYICFEIVGENVSLEYMEQYFEAGLMNREIQAFAQEGARNHGLLNIAVDDFFNSKIVLPSFEEQQAIAEILSAADREIELLRQDLEQEKQKKKALMQLLLTGIVRVKP